VIIREQAAPSYNDLGSPEHRNWIRRMRQVMAFRNLPPANLRTLLDRMETVVAKTGDVIVRQGEQGDYYYVLTDGKARVTQSIELAKLVGGDSFGEEALLTGVPRNATVTMLEDGQLMRLSKKDFDSLLKEPMLKRLSADEARQQIKQGACWLDIRYAREHNHNRLPGAVNIPLHELRSRLDELDTSISYICYCSTGRRSSAAAFLLAQKGFRASVLNGGIQIMTSDQVSAGRPAERPATEEV
jgi:rhodanese-related sulfurtransferase